MTNKALPAAVLVMWLCLGIFFTPQQSISAPLPADTSINYLYPKRASSNALAVQGLLGLAAVKHRLENYMTGKIKIPQQAAAIPKSLQKNYRISVTQYNGQKVWTIQPKANVSAKTILYVHGGAYILNISSFQWKFVEALLQKTNATIIVPDYPLAPAAHCTDVYRFIQTVYRQLLQSGILPQNITVMGDSAGGGLALGLAEQLKADNEPQPAQIILLSPWLDITMSNQPDEETNKHDKMLSVEGLRLAGKAYAGNLNGTDFRVSPVYGNLSGLGKISLFIGTHDLFIADCRKLKTLLQQKGIAFNYFEYPRMFHGWMVVTGLKESKCAIRQIAGLISN